MNPLRLATMRPEWKLHWLMSSSERLALQALLEKTRPELSLEIGTYQGGSLQVLAHYSRKVISLDIDPGVETRLQPLFGNVEFRTGNSTTLLPSLVQELNRTGNQPDFVLIDADHSTEAVRRDIKAVLQLRIAKPMLVLMHDSFNPDCRAGILGVGWEQNPHVTAVDVDFVQGIYHKKAFDTAAARTMWGGFACAVLDPAVRSEPLEVQRTHQAIYDGIFPLSSHFPPKNIWAVRIFRGAKRRLQNMRVFAR
jgi:cephalosporin hydroxylase